MTRHDGPVPLRELPHLHHEEALWVNGALWVAGIDEAGRGALAGPVVAGAVVLPQIPFIKQDLYGVRDSKKMTPHQREYWAQIIKDLAVSWGLGAASPQEIDLLGIVPATRLASLRAVDALDVCPDCLLLDYLKLPEISVTQISIPKGDMVSLSVAAASVLAKTARDAILVALEERHPGYGFAQHKGYGTAAHVQALEHMGPSPAHRYSFAPIRADGEH